MADNEVNWQEKLAYLRTAYAQALPEKLKQIDAAALDWYKTPTSRDKLEALYLLVHNLAGSGATFGFTDISKNAQILEHLLKKALSKPVLDCATITSDVHQLMTQLAASFPALTQAPQDCQ